MIMSAPASIFLSSLLILLIQVGSVGVEGRRHGKRGPAIQGAARKPHAVVHLLDQTNQFEG